MSEFRLPVGGALITVVPCSATSRERLRLILEEFRMPELMPEVTTPKAALRAAMSELFPAPDSKVRHSTFAHKNGSEGYRIGRHAPSENVHVDDRFVEAIAIATLRMRYLPLEEGQKKPKSEWTGEIKLEPWDGDKERDILAYMKHITEYVPSGKLRETVTGIVQRLGGRRLIEDQPLMWLTADAIPLFKQIKYRIEEASARKDHRGKDVEPTRIAVFSVLADEEMAKEVISMLMGVVDRETARVEGRLAQPALSIDQAGNDITKALAVKEELERYEKLLKQPLTGLKAKADSLVISIANKSIEKATMGI